MLTAISPFHFVFYPSRSAAAKLFHVVVWRWWQSLSFSLNRGFSRYAGCYSPGEEDGVAAIKEVKVHAYAKIGQLGIGFVLVSTSSRS